MTFDAGSFTSGLLTGLREGVEAALIVAIVLAYLQRTGNGRYASRVWVGVLVASLVSALLGGILFATIGGLPSPYEQIFEGLTMLVAAAVVTWMLFWMRRQAMAVKGELHAAVDRVLGRGGAWGLTILVFSAVIREGIETALFLVGQAQAARIGSAQGPTLVLIGALAGLGLAVIMGWGFYHGSHRVDLRQFFRWTGIALVFIAAGLLDRAIHEFIEIGAIRIGTGTAFNIGSQLPDDRGVGQFLRALLGYSAAPEVLTATAWLAYVVVVLLLYLRPVRPGRVKPAGVGETARP